MTQPPPTFKSLTPSPGAFLPKPKVWKMDWSLSQIPMCANSVLSSFFFKRTLKKKKLVPRANEVIGASISKISQIENVV